MCKALHLANDIEGKLQEVINTYDQLLKDQEKNNDLLCDIEHIIEFDKFNAYEGYLYAKKLQETRNTRRSIKNELKTLRPLYEYAKQRMNDMKMKKESITKQDSELEKSGYNMRVLKFDGRKRINHVQGIKSL